MTRSAHAIVVLTAAGAILSLSGCGGGDPEEEFAEDTAGIEWNQEEGGMTLLDLGYDTCKMLDQGTSIIDVETLWNMNGLTQDYASRVLVKASIDNLCPEYDSRPAYDLLDDRE